MASIPFQKRPNDLFVSYGHSDEALVGPIVDWLRLAGLKIWYDTSDGDASKRSAELLTRGLQSARGALFFLSPNWQASTWCKDEHELALTERRATESYLLVAVQLRPLDLPAWFTLSNVLNFSTFDARSAVQLLRSLDFDSPLRLDNTQDVYFAGPWSRPSNAARKILRLMFGRGWRVVGDSPDHPHFTDAKERITSIVQTCRGLVAVLPYNEMKPPSYTSPWIIDEAEIAMHCEKPFLLLAENNVQVPEALAIGAFSGKPIPISDEGLKAPYQDVLEQFDDELSRFAYSDKGAYSFLATSLASFEEADLLKAVIEQATKIPCIRGLQLRGQHVQRAIIDRIRNAAFCLADVSDNNRNALIEAGVALGAGTPLHLISEPPQDGSFKRRFMFEDLEMNWYTSSLDRIASAYRIARGYRRRLFPSG